MSVNKKKIVIIGFFIIFIISILSIQGYYSNIKYNNKILMVSSIYWQKINNIISKYNNKIQSCVLHFFTKTNTDNYNVVSLMNLSHEYINKGDFINAEKQLQIALNQTYEKNLKSIIYLSLARVKLYQKKMSEALKILENIKSIGWLALAENLKGDIKIIEGDLKSARKAYEKALQFNISQSFNILIRIKLNNLLD